MILIGFCGLKENHVSIPTYKVFLEARTSRYNNILHTFDGDKVGGFSRVMMVCPFCASLHHLIFSVVCTCTCFDSSWVKN